MKRPYSYVLPSFQFPRDVELWDRAGRLVRKLADVPMSDTVPVNGVFDGPRGFTFHPVQADRLFWAEALDKGDPKVKVPQRDRVVMLKAPFTAEPTEVFKTEWRYAGLAFTENGTAIANEFDRPSRMRRAWLFDNDFADTTSQDMGAAHRGCVCGPGVPGRPARQEGDHAGR